MQIKQARLISFNRVILDPGIPKQNLILRKLKNSTRILFIDFLLSFKKSNTNSLNFSMSSSTSS